MLGHGFWFASSRRPVLLVPLPHNPNQSNINRNIETIWTAHGQESEWNLNIFPPIQFGTEFFFLFIPFFFSFKLARLSHWDREGVGVAHRHPATRFPARPTSTDDDNSSALSMTDWPGTDQIGWVQNNTNNSAGLGWNRKKNEKYWTVHASIHFMFISKLQSLVLYRFGWHVFGWGEVGLWLFGRVVLEYFWRRFVLVFFAQSRKVSLSSGKLSARDVLRLNGNCLGKRNQIQIGF